jgi:hypothetical protein
MKTARFCHSELFVDAHQILQNLFADAVLRMRFSGENELHGTFRVVNHFQKSVQIRRQQIPAFVSGDAARETDG